MLLSLVYLILRRLLAMGHHPEGERDIELLVLPSSCTLQANGPLGPCCGCLG